MSGDADYSAWVGRSEERRDFVTPGPLDRLSALLDRDDPPAAPGDPVPPLGHWLFFLPSARQSGIGPDGHPTRGGFLPPIHDLPRRMWAGSRIAFPGEIRVGREVVERSTIAAVQGKEGRSGRLVFVTVRREIGEAGAAPAIIDEQDLVFRGLSSAPARNAAEPVAPGAWHRTLVADPVLLFRYSAVTFNGHRIHYDRDYATRGEGYPGLVVHGPLLATLLVDLARRSAPDSRVAAFAFTALSPLFDGQPFALNGTPPGPDGVARLWAADADGRPTMTAQVTLRPSAAR